MFITFSEGSFILGGQKASTDKTPVNTQSTTTTEKTFVNKQTRIPLFKLFDFIINPNAIIFGLFLNWIQSIFVYNQIVLFKIIKTSVFYYYYYYLLRTRNNNKINIKILIMKQKYKSLFWRRSSPLTFFMASEWGGTMCFIACI